MFTGIVEDLGVVRKIARGSLSIKLTIETKKILEDAKIGDSIAVNGICLTVTNIEKPCFTADVMPETMRRTNLEGLKENDRVNLERALRLQDRLGGHIVTGHIDGTGNIIKKEEEDNAVWVTIQAPQDVLKYIVFKGSVAIDGTSLTVAYVDDSNFKVSLIPLTAGETTLGVKKIGEQVNIECDIIGKYIERMLFMNDNFQGKAQKKEDISIDFLRENGFA